MTDYWLTGEAISVYVRSAGLFGNEMHSPIMCVGHGVPAVVCRFAEQTSKGFMWNDIGLENWLFDHDLPCDRERIVGRQQSTIADCNIWAQKDIKSLYTLVVFHARIQN